MAEPTNSLTEKPEANSEPAAPPAKPFWREVDFGNGTGKQRFEADTAEELLDMLATAQENANRKIREQQDELKRVRQTVTPDPVTPARTEFKPKPLTADDRHRIAQKMQNPATSRDAVIELVEAELGAPLAEVRTTLNAYSEVERREKLNTEAAKFARAYPIWHQYTVEQRIDFERMIYEYCDQRKYGYTAKNFGIAFENLRQTGLIPEAQPQPSTDRRTGADSPENSHNGADSPNEVVRPRGSFSSGLRNSDMSGSRPPAAKKLTWKDVDDMSQKDFDHKLATDPEFRKQVDALPAR